MGPLRLKISTHDRKQDSADMGRWTLILVVMMVDQNVGLPISAVTFKFILKILQLIFVEFDQSLTPFTQFNRSANEFYSQYIISCNIYGILQIFCLYFANVA